MEVEAKASKTLSNRYSERFQFLTRVFIVKQSPDTSLPSRYHCCEFWRHGVLERRKFFSLYTFPPGNDLEALFTLVSDASDSC